MLDVHNKIEPDKETGRVEAFSDGVFGIAMTLLVLELHVPSIHESDGPVTASMLGAALLKHWPGYFAFLTSFSTILTMWVHHHGMFRLIRRTDSLLLFTNGLLLLLVTVVPFPTAVLAAYLRTDAARMAAGFYAGVFLFIAIAFGVLLKVALRPRMVMSSAPPEIVARFRASYRFGPLWYVLALLSAFFSTWLCLGICTALYVYWTVVTIDCRQEAAAAG